jgi:hypothetical protein
MEERENQNKPQPTKLAPDALNESAGQPNQLSAFAAYAWQRTLDRNYPATGKAVVLKNECSY